MKIVKENISLIVIGLICVLLISYEPVILKLNNISNISKQASLIAIFALGQSMALIAKGLDLSQGGTITLVSVSVALLSSRLGLLLAIPAGLLLGGGIGFVNGFVISRFRVSPFVVTLGVGFLAQGIALVLSRGQPVYNVPAGFTFWGWHEVLGIPLIVFVLLMLSVIVHIYLAKIIYGRYLYAIGSNEKASLLTGINVVKHKMLSYVYCGIITAVGAVILASRINCGHPVEGANTALQSVAASVIGGISLFGGKGSTVGVILGSLLLAFISNILNIVNVSSYYQQIMVGVIIILAVVLDKLKLKNRNNEE